MNRYVILLLALSLLVLSIPISIQAKEPSKEVTITGTVTDHTGETLPGVVVKIKNLPYGTITDADGFYLLRGKFAKGAKIVFSCVGMKTVEFDYFGQDQQDAAMQENVEMLGELVVKAESNINNIDNRARSRDCRHEAPQRETDGKYRSGPARSGSRPYRHQRRRPWLQAQNPYSRQPIVTWRRCCQ